jgi:hypothetical protein
MADGIGWRTFALDLRQINVTAGYCSNAGAAFAPTSGTFSVVYLTVAHSRGQSMITDGDAVAHISYANIVGNTVKNGGCLFATRHGMAIDDCWFSGNDVDLGAASDDIDPPFELTRCIFAGDAPKGSWAHIGQDCREKLATESLKIRSNDAAICVLSCSASPA